MLWVVATGAALPSQPMDVLSPDGLGQRRTVLLPQYVAATGNSDPAAALKNSAETPTDLGARAAEAALSAAGVTADQLGLIIAECGTPHQLIPSEAHRIARRFNVKIPAYDIYGGGASIPLIFSNLLSWKRERLPRYILVVTTNCPTQRVLFTAGDEHRVVGDGAAAFLLSPEVEGPTALLDAQYQAEPLRYREQFAEMYGHLKIDSAAETWMSGAILKALDQGRRRSAGSGPGRLYVVTSLYRPGAQSAALAAAGLSAAVALDDAGGYQLGSTSAVRFASQRDRLPPGSILIGADAGPGLSSGYYIIEQRGE